LSVAGSPSGHPARRGDLIRNLECSRKPRQQDAYFAGDAADLTPCTQWQEIQEALRLQNDKALRGTLSITA